MSVTADFEAANQQYAAQFTKADLPMPPGRKVLILTCMDARIDPARALGLSEGDAHVIRNGGGRAADSLRSIIISQQLLGTREIVLIHHTDCGMMTFSDEALRSKIRTELDESAEHFSFLPIRDLHQSLADDKALLQKSELVLDVPITSYIYDVKTGAIHKV
ncbi:hypothetical protein V2A60_002801 [Cordyceps javanica]|uniref:Carbonic anhydrase n=1 Tax=Cordyceps javanica TaxID=43265 RepID=A0A545UXG7_9HYPO|nr:carbonic anhydrase [Cordyceps javanica]TQW06016.1 carbonic anhydrase [Cordyceps javanica]